MSIKAFFNQIDDTLRSKEIEQKAKEAKSRVETEKTINFANRLIEVVEQYIPEFEKRGFRCESRTGNLPYWHFEVINPSGNRIKLAIVTGHSQEYEIAFFKNNERINATIYIRDDFDKEVIENELQNLFKKLV